MILVGLTGGIGSGKTTIANFFKELKVPVYISDIEAKQLMNRSKVVKRKLIKLLGDQAYIEGKLNNSYIRDIIFKNKELRLEVNAIVHPKVAAHFNRWVQKQQSSYVIKESAILFETKGHIQCDYVITITGDIDERIKRVIKRDGKSKQQVEAIMESQLPDEYKISNSDYTIYNDKLEDSKSQVLKVHQDIIRKIEAS